MSVVDKKQPEGKASKLTAKQETAISALLSNSTIKDAARCARIGEATLFRWLQQEEFKAVYRAARKQTVNHAIAQLQGACSEAVDTLRDVMEDTSNLASSRVSAAKAVLETSMKAVEQEELISRIEALEKVAEQSGGKTT